MSTEETKEAPEREKEVSVPLDFDRYVASELRALGQRITDLKGIMDERFAHMDERFVALEKSMDERFVALKESMEGQLAQADKRFSEFRENVNMRFENVNMRFDKLESTLKWSIGLFVPVIVGILAIIIKVFFFGKFP